MRFLEKYWADCPRIVVDLGDGSVVNTANIICENGIEY